MNIEPFDEAKIDSGEPEYCSMIAAYLVRKCAQDEALWGNLDMNFATFPIGQRGFVEINEPNGGWFLGMRISRNYWFTEYGHTMSITPKDRFMILRRPAAITFEDIVKKPEIPEYICPHCGECIGRIGRFFMWLSGPGAHNCKAFRSL